MPRAAQTGVGRLAHATAPPVRRIGRHPDAAFRSAAGPRAPVHRRATSTGTRTRTGRRGRWCVHGLLGLLSRGARPVAELAVEADRPAPSYAYGSVTRRKRALCTSIPPRRMSRNGPAAGTEPREIAERWWEP
ncbi:hypothetical protein E4K10_07795 [Streptomyces sp. T1317-0309]|nr:hypothetical protein E4K10_07795 [Streptomyces sp. T1317-0309]